MNLKTLSSLALLALLALPANLAAQKGTYNQMDADGNVSRRSSRQATDSLSSNKEIPTGIKVWTVDSKFGDISKASLDTMSHMFMNTIFTTGLSCEYNKTGNLAAPRINRVFIERPEAGQFLFTQPSDFFIKAVDNFHFTNTLSPFTNLTYNTAGDRTNGEDRVTAKFGVNAGKKLGVGFNFDYIYGRGYYQNQSTSHFNDTMYGSYLGDRYQAHFLFPTNHQTVKEHGERNTDGTGAQLEPQRQPTHLPHPPLQRWIQPQGEDERRRDKGKEVCPGVDARKRSTKKTCTEPRR